MAAAAAAGPAAQPANPPPVAIGRLVVAAASTHIARGAAAAGSLAPDLWTLPHDSPVVKSVRFVTWDVPAGNGPAAIAVSEMQGLCLSACTFNTDDGVASRALRAANLIETALSRTQCSAILQELAESRMFEKEFASETDWFETLTDNTLINRQLLIFQPTWLVALDPFDTPGRAAAGPAGRRRGAAAQVVVDGAVAPVAGPDSLKFLHLTSWESVIKEGAAQMPGQEARVLARVITLLSHRVRAVTRADDSSDIQAAAATLTTYVSAWANLGSRATASQLARQTPAYLASCLSIMPPDLAGTCGTAAACEAELRDCQTLLRGRESESLAVVWSRIHSNLARFPVLCHFKGRNISSGATKGILERLMIGMQIPAGSPLIRVWELSRTLETRGKDQTVRDLFAAGSTAAQVVDELLEAHSATAGSASVPDSGLADSGAAASSGTGGAASSGAMEQKEFERAVSSPNFVEAYEAIKDADGVSVIDAAGTSGSILMLRFLFTGASWMRPRHPAFDVVGKHLAERANYLAYCITAESDEGEVPRDLSTYCLREAQSEAFWNCKWDDIDMVNTHPDRPYEGGFLAIRYLQNGTRYSKVADFDHYTVEACLLGVREWFGRLLTGIGFSSQLDEGYSWYDVVDRQLEFVRYLNGLPTSERDGWRKWADTNFRQHALQRAQTIFRARLMTSHPADEVITHFLPDGATFFSNITNRLEDAKPIATVRKAFPSFFSAEAVTLPGTSQTQRASDGGGERGAGAGRQGDGKAKGKAAGKMKERDDAPGSKSDLAKILKDGQLFLAAKVGDINAMADSLKVKVDDYCWPVLFSNKPGKAALALCPCPDKHGNMESKWHRPPKGFNREQLTRKFWSAASLDQLKEAGWRTAKRSKI